MILEEVKPSDPEPSAERADSDHHGERSAIADALNALRVLKRDTLNYPDWNSQ